MKRSELFNWLFKENKQKIGDEVLTVIIKGKLFTTTDYCNSYNCALATTIKNEFKVKKLWVGGLGVDVDDYSYDIESPAAIAYAYDNKSTKDLTVKLVNRGKRSRS